MIYCIYLKLFEWMNNVMFIVGYLDIECIYGCALHVPGPPPPHPPWYGPPPYPTVLAATVVVLVLVLPSTSTT